MSRKIKDRSPCSDCQWGPPELSYENNVVLNTLNMFGPSLGNGFGGIDMGSLESAFRIFKIPPDDQPWLFRMISIFFSARRKNAK